MGTIEERLTDNGLKAYRAKIRLKGYPPQSATFSKKTDAKIWIQQTETEIREGRYFNKVQAKKFTVTDVIDRYLETLSKNNAGRVKDVKPLLMWWREEIGHYLLSDLTKDVLIRAREKLQNKKRQRIRPEDENQFIASSTVNRYWIAIKTALNMATNEWEWITSNPMNKIKQLSEPEGRKRFLSDKERKRLLQECKKSNNAYLYIIVVIALSTGARRSEILNLKWSDVDFDKGAIRLYKTKNKEPRSLYLHGEALSLLNNLRKNPVTDSPFLFASIGNPKKVMDIKKSWQSALDRADVNDFRFHDLRHSAASYLAMNGATLAEIAEVLGHKTLEMVKRYAHLTDSHTSNVVKKMNDKIFEASDED